MKNILALGIIGYVLVSSAYAYNTSSVKFVHQSSQDTSSGTLHFGEERAEE